MLSLLLMGAQNVVTWYVLQVHCKIRYCKKMSLHQLQKRAQDQTYIMQVHNRFPFELIDKRKINRMISQVRLIIVDLLNKIADVYSQNAIRYPVNQFEPAIARMLLPLEFNVLVNQDEVEYLFESSWWDEVSEKAIKKDFRGYIGPKLQKQKRISCSESEKQDLLIEETSRKIQKKLVELNKGQRYEKAQIVTTQDYSNRALQKNKELLRRSYGYEGDSRMPSHGYEDSIRRWTIQQFNNGSVVTKEGIRAYARSIGAKSDFKASQRWCESFLSRNPDIKEIIYFEKKKQKLMMIKMNADDPIQQQESSSRMSNNGFRQSLRRAKLYEESDSQQQPSQIDDKKAESIKLNESTNENKRNQAQLQHQPIDCPLNDSQQEMYPQFEHELKLENIQNGYNKST